MSPKQRNRPVAFTVLAGILVVLSVAVNDAGFEGPIPIEGSGE